MKIPFGKYKDKEIKTLPPKYLIYLTKLPLYGEVEAEVYSTLKLPLPPQPPKTPTQDIMVEDLFKNRSDIW